MKNFFKNSACLIVFGTGILLTADTQLLAQTEDPLILKPLERYSADFASPWGVVATGRYLFKKSEPGQTPYEEGYQTQMRSDGKYGLHLYYDAWQIGLNYKEYGNTVTILSRNIGRDAYRGWGVEIGQSTLRTVFVADYETKTEIRSTDYNALITGLTYSGRTGLGSSLEFSFLYDVAAGIFKAEEEVTGYTVVDLGLGARVPISESAVTVNLVGSVYLGPPGTLYIGPGNGSYDRTLANNFNSQYTHVTAGLGLNVAYAFNFYK